MQNMREPRTSYSQPPVELDIDTWLYECHPKAGCGVCAALFEQRAEADKKGDTRKKFDLSREIRNCDHKKVKAKKNE